MNRLQRIKKVVKYAIIQGIGENQAQIGQKMGYNSYSAFSHVLNGSDKEPINFVGRLSTLIPNLNVQWIETGEGEMINDSEQKVAQIVCESDDISKVKAIVQLLVKKHERELVAKNVQITKTQDQITKSQEQISKSQEQIDRLISLLEKK